MREDTRRYIASIRFTDPDTDKPDRVEKSFDTVEAAGKCVFNIYQDGYVLVDPPPALQDDGICAIYLPASRIISITIRIEDQQQINDKMRAHLDQRKAEQDAMR